MLCVLLIYICRYVFRLDPTKKLKNIPTPIFWQKLKVGIFPKFFQHRVAYDQ